MQFNLIKFICRAFSKSRVLHVAALAALVTFAAPQAFADAPKESKHKTYVMVTATNVNVGGVIKAFCDGDLAARFLNIINAAKGIIDQLLKLIEDFINGFKLNNPLDCFKNFNPQVNMNVFGQCMTNFKFPSFSCNFGDLSGVMDSFKGCTANGGFDVSGLNLDGVQACLSQVVQIPNAPDFGGLLLDLVNQLNALFDFSDGDILALQGMVNLCNQYSNGSIALSKSAIQKQKCTRRGTRLVCVLKN